MIRDGNNEESRMEDDKWSAPFEIENIEDFQVCLKCVKGHKSKDWSQPQEANNFHRYVRISISTENDATLFICFLRPKFPEYYIYNSTDNPVVFKQVGCEQPHQIF